MPAAKTSDFQSLGYQLFDGYLQADDCHRLLHGIDEYKKANGASEIHRPTKGRSLRYSVIDGEAIRRDLPEIWKLYTGEISRLVSQLTGAPLVPLENTKAGVNVNLMPPGRSEYRWHYDRAAVTAILYLNAVEGGETEIYPNYRILLAKHRPRTQRALDGLLHARVPRSVFGKKRVVHPKPGRLVTMRGNRSWHSVRGVEGDTERVNVILAYDRPGAGFTAEKGLDSYLYTDEQAGGKDPNYFG